MNIYQAPRKTDPKVALKEGNQEVAQKRESLRGNQNPGQEIRKRSPGQDPRIGEKDQNLRKV